MPLHAFPGALASGYSSVQRTNTGVTTVSHTGGAAHTYNATWTELVASTPWDTSGFTLRLNTAIGSSAARSDTLVVIGIGAASSEQVIVGPFTAGFKTTQFRLSLPLNIPAGSRIAVRHKSARASLAISYHIDLFRDVGPHVWRGPQRWVPYGNVDDASNSRGTAVTAGNSNAFGSWTSLTASTTYAHSLWFPLIDAGTASSSTALNYRTQFAIASTGDSATIATNGTVWDGPIWATTTAEVQQDNMTSGGSGAWAMGDGRFSNNGLLYAPTTSGAAVSMKAMCSGTAEATVAGSILAAVM